jgi:hypothetical protein
MDNRKFEQLIDLIINENEEQAKALFHDIVVEKSREIYESMMDEELEEGYTVRRNRGGQVGDMMDEVSGDMKLVKACLKKKMNLKISTWVTKKAEMMRFGVDDMGADDDMEMGGEEDLEDRVVDLEDKLDELMAEFEELMGQEGGEEDMGGEEDFGASDEEGEEEAGDDEMMEQEGDQKTH